MACTQSPWNAGWCRRKRQKKSGTVFNKKQKKQEKFGPLTRLESRFSAVSFFFLWSFCCLLRQCLLIRNEGERKAVPSGRHAIESSVLEHLSGGLIFESVALHHRKKNARKKKESLPRELNGTASLANSIERKPPMIESRKIHLFFLGQWFRFALTADSRND